MQVYILSTKKIEDIKIHKNMYLNKLNDVELRDLGVLRVVIDPICNTNFYDIEQVGVQDGNIWRVGCVSTPKSIEDIKIYLNDIVNRVARDKINAITSKYTPAEMAVWYTLEAEALNDDSTGILGAEALIAGIPFEDYRDNILAKATSFKDFKTQVCGTRAKLSLQIEALSTLEECIEFEVTAKSW